MRSLKSKRIFHTQFVLLNSLIFGSVVIVCLNEKSQRQEVWRIAKTIKLSSICALFISFLLFSFIGLVWKGGGGALAFCFKCWQARVWVGVSLEHFLFLKLIRMPLFDPPSVLELQRDSQALVWFDCEFKQRRPDITYKNIDSNLLIFRYDECSCLCPYHRVYIFHMEKHCKTQWMTLYYGNLF